MITIRLALLIICSLALGEFARAERHNYQLPFKPLLLAQAAVSPAAPPATESQQPARKPDILYVPTPQDLVEEMLKTAAVKKDEVVYDLGCGDGRIVITAAAKYGARGIGIDIDPARITDARAGAEKAGVADRVKFLQADLFLSDFRDADVIALYLLSSLNVKLRPKIFAETKPGTRIVSHAFSMDDWEPDDFKQLEGRRMFYWVVPANLSGRWKVQAKGGQDEPHTFTIDQRFQKITGSIEENGQPRQIAEGKVTGNQFEFTVAAEPGKQPQKVTGTINGDQIEATSQADSKLTWTATREEGTQRDIVAAKE